MIEDLKTEGGQRKGNGIFQGIFSELLGGRARAPRVRVHSRREFAWL